MHPKLLVVNACMKFYEFKFNILEWDFVLQTMNVIHHVLSTFMVHVML